MQRFRSIIVGATAASLLAVPLAAAAESVHTSAPGVSAPARYTTSIRFLDFDHTREFGSTTTIRGQVAVPALNGAVQGKKVKLYRKLGGTSHWAYLDTKYTSHQAQPGFRFSVTSRGNADYRVVFAGNARLRPSRNSTGVSVYRHVSAKIDDGSRRFHGRITPGYAHRVVFLDKRTCASCGWHRVTSRRAGSRGTFHFRVNAPRHGKYYWRTSTPPSTRFIRSYSAVFTTQLR